MARSKASQVKKGVAVRIADKRDQLKKPKKSKQIKVEKQETPKKDDVVPPKVPRKQTRCIGKRRLKYYRWLNKPGARDAILATNQGSVTRFIKRVRNSIHNASEKNVFCIRNATFMGPVVARNSKLLHTTEAKQLYTELIEKFVTHQLVQAKRRITSDKHNLMRGRVKVEHLPFPQTYYSLT